MITVITSLAGGRKDHAYSELKRKRLTSICEPLFVQMKLTPNLVA